MSWGGGGGGGGGNDDVGGGGGENDAGGVLILASDVFRKVRVTMAARPTTELSLAATDGYARADVDAAAEPDVVADGDGFGAFPFFAAGVGFEGMGCGEELDVGADLDVVADGDFGDVEGDESPVDEGAGADVGLVAVVAAEGGADGGGLAEETEELAEDAITHSG